MRGSAAIAWSATKPLVELPPIAIRVGSTCGTVARKSITRGMLPVASVVMSPK